MTDRMQRIETFFSACTDLADGKYAEAERHISAALAAIAASEDLTGLFTAVTQNYDYVSAKRNFLRLPADGASHGSAYLPAERSDLLAFVFCLFVELDSGTMQLGDLLSRHFYVDGSYTASFTLFAQRVVRPFRDIVRDCYPAVRGTEAAAKSDVFEKLAALIPLERKRVFALSLRDADRQAAGDLLGGLASAAVRREGDGVKAILAGYRYFLRFLGAENELSAQIFALAARL